MKSVKNGTDSWGKVGFGIHRFRKVISIVLIICTLALSLLAIKLPGVLKGDGFRTNGEREATQAILRDDFKQSDNTVLLVFEKEAGATKEKFQTETLTILDKIQKEEKLEAFHTPATSADMMKDDIAYATVLLKGENDKDQQKKTLAFTEKIGQESNASVKVMPTGMLIINDEVTKKSQEDLKKAELIGVPLAFLVLLFSFGSFVAAILPILNGALSVISAMGILYLIGDKMDLSIFVLNVTPMVGLALSIDFALLFVNRFREELPNRSVKEAIGVTYQTAGRAIMFSGLCVFIGLSGLFLFNIDFIRSIAVSGMIVTIFSLIISLTLLPALLSILGKQMIRKGVLSKLVSSKSENEGLWRKFGIIVMNNPAKMTIGVLLFIVVCLVPLRTADLQFPDVNTLPSTSETRMAYEKYEAAFQPDLASHAEATIVVETKGDIRKNLGTVEKMIQQLEKDSEVKSVTSFYSYLNGMDSKMIEMALATPQGAPIEQALAPFVNGNKTYINVLLTKESTSKEAKAWVRDFHEKYDGKTEATLHIGGMTKFTQELEDEVVNRIPLAALVILGSTFLILMIAFKSLLIPLKAIIMNILSLSATIGIVLWLFNGGHFGLEAGPVMFTLPVFIFGLVFGLSMDYEVFLISRMQEIYQETGDNDHSTLEGLVSTSKIITSAALIMIVVTGAFSFTEVLPMQQMGIGVALAIFIDATIIRMLLVPSLMKMFGHWNWWLPWR